MAAYVDIADKLPWHDPGPNAGGAAAAVGTRGGAAAPVGGDDLKGGAVEMSSGGLLSRNNSVRKVVAAVKVQGSGLLRSRSTASSRTRGRSEGGNLSDSEGSESGSEGHSGSWGERPRGDLVWHSAAATSSINRP